MIGVQKGDTNSIIQMSESSLAEKLGGVQVLDAKDCRPRFPQGAHVYFDANAFQKERHAKSVVGLVNSRAIEPNIVLPIEEEIRNIARDPQDDDQRNIKKYGLNVLKKLKKRNRFNPSDHFREDLGRMHACSVLLPKYQAYHATNDHFEEWYRDISQLVHHAQARGIFPSIDSIRNVPHHTTLDTLFDIEHLDDDLERIYTKLVAQKTDYGTRYKQDVVDGVISLAGQYGHSPGIEVTTQVAEELGGYFSMAVESIWCRIVGSAVLGHDITRGVKNTHWRFKPNKRSRENDGQLIVGANKGNPRIPRPEHTVIYTSDGDIFAGNLLFAATSYDAPEQGPQYASPSPFLPSSRLAA